MKMYDAVSPELGSTTLKLGCCLGGGGDTDGGGDIMRFSLQAL